MLNNNHHSQVKMISRNKNHHYNNNNNSSSNGSTSTTVKTGQDIPKNTLHNYQNKHKNHQHINWMGSIMFLYMMKEFYILLGNKFRECWRLRVVWRWWRSIIMGWLIWRLGWGRMCLLLMGRWLWWGSEWVKKYKR